jgi:hypothetical protein
MSARRPITSRKYPAPLAPLVEKCHGPGVYAASRARNRSRAGTDNPVRPNCPPIERRASMRALPAPRAADPGTWQRQGLAAGVVCATLSVT